MPDSIIAALFILTVTGVSQAGSGGSITLNLLGKATIGEISTVITVPPLQDAISKCVFEGVTASRCHKKEKSECFSADFDAPYPLPPVSLKSIDNECPERKLVVKWLPQSRVRVTDAYSRVLQALPSERYKCDTKRSVCLSLFSTNEYNLDGDTYTASALCTRIYIAGNLGAPENCRLVVIKVNGKVLLPAITALRTPPAFGVLPVESIKVYIDDSIASERVLKSVRDALSGDPLSLILDERLAGSRGSEYALSISGIGGPRYSKDLRLFEQVTVRVLQYLPKGEANTLKYRSKLYTENSQLEVTFSLATNEQSTPYNWSLPPDIVNNKYLVRLKTIIGRGLATLCLSSDWVDGDKFLCKTNEY